VLVGVAIVPTMTRRRSAWLGLALAGLAVACSEQEASPGSGVAIPVPVDRAGAQTSSRASASPPVACPNAPCPLFDWMETRMEVALVEGDFLALATQFDTVAGWAPVGYANWASIARDGASAARAGAADAARAACRSCHDQFGSRYERELRSHPM